MNEDDPPPLTAASDTPEELRAVLRALGREGPGRTTLERVARELGPYLDAAPGLQVPVAAVARDGGRFLAARALAGLLALGGSAILVQHAWPEPVAPRVRQASASAGPPVRHLPGVETIAPEGDVGPPTVVALEAEQPAPVEPSARERRRHHHRHRERGKVSSVEAGTGTGSRSSEVGAQEAPAVTRSEQTAKRTDEEEEQEEPRRKEPPPDEVALLWRARERLRREPAVALALLDEHADRFAEGQLAPERELLAVEALRLLGRKPEADTRERTFRERYPGSIHLRRLQNGK